MKERFRFFAGRVSSETTRANRTRGDPPARAYVLAGGLRRLGLNARELARARVSTIRTKPLKTGAQIRVTAGKAWVSMASRYPWRDLHQRVWTNLRRRTGCGAPRRICLRRIQIALDGRFLAFRPGIQPPAGIQKPPAKEARWKTGSRSAV